MKTVRHLDELATALPQARREAQAAFGNPRLYLERLVDRPRHIEVQIFADASGDTVHLFERECSAQRRHQKVVEKRRRRRTPPCAQIGAAAVTSPPSLPDAGTVEFLLEGDGDDAVLLPRDNTRLQVNIHHPNVVVDLVRAQLAVAGGRAAGRSLNAAMPRCIYAEDRRGVSYHRPARLLSRTAGPAFGGFRRGRRRRGVVC
jgi:acetyl/propionyl-CoA carboxylase alpha subunit